MSTLGSFIWSIADQLRGPYRPNQYGNVILPLTILRRLDCILEPDRETVRELAKQFENPNRLKVEVKRRRAGRSTTPRTTPSPTCWPTRMGWQTT